VPPRITWRSALDIATRPAWLWHLVRARRREFGNMAEAVRRAGGVSFSQFVQSQFDASVSWQDLERFRAQWRGRLIIKGIMDPEDASRAVALGADALVVSNHGGRQLDGAPSSVAMLPAVLEAVRGRAEVLLDSGIRSGQDILRARALGASAALVGRAWLYGLGALGQQGVTLALQIMSRELQVSLALTGCNDVNELGRAHLI
jgi:L-lactate dehydrogenase (cytochrome)